MCKSDSFGFLYFESLLAMELSVCLTDSDFHDTQVEDAILSPLGLAINPCNCREPADIVSKCRHAAILLIQWAEINRQVLEGLPRLKALVRYGIGVDMIDVQAATELGVIVCNTPTYCIDEVATHTFSLLLYFARGLNNLSLAVSKQRWGLNAVATPFHHLSALTLGLIGFGRIAKKIAQYARVFGLKTVACDPYVTSDGTPLVSLEVLLRQSDFISLHTPLTKETRHIIDRSALEMMKSTAFLVNTARGDLVNSADLNAALRTGRIAGAALDVLPHEPPNWDEPLLSAPNLLITPHLAWYSIGSLEKMRQEAAGSIAQLVQGQSPSGLLNPSAFDSGRWVRERA